MKYAEPQAQVRYSDLLVILSKLAKIIVTRFESHAACFLGEEEAMRLVAWAIILPLIFVGLGATRSVDADGWEWAPADPPVTLPDLISRGGRVEGWLAGRASNFIPNMEPDTDFSAAGYLVSHDGKLYRCITQDSESIGDGNCSVAVNR